MWCGPDKVPGDESLIAQRTRGALAHERLFSAEPWESPGGIVGDDACAERE